MYIYISRIARQRSVPLNAYILYQHITPGVATRGSTGIQRRYAVPVRTHRRYS